MDNYYLYIDILDDDDNEYSDPQYLEWRDIVFQQECEFTPKVSHVISEQ